MMGIGGQIEIIRRVLESAKAELANAKLRRSSADLTDPEQDYLTGFGLAHAQLEVEGLKATLGSLKLLTRFVDQMVERGRG